MSQTENKTFQAGTCEVQKYWIPVDRIDWIEFKTWKGSTVTFWKDDIYELKASKRKGQDGRMYHVTTIYSEEHRRPVVVKEKLESVYRRLGWDNLQ